MLTYPSRVESVDVDQAERDAFPVTDPVSEEHGNTDPGRYVDVAALLAGGLPDPPQPVLLHRDDGHALFYAGQVNVLFGDPESGKTLVAQAAVVEALRDGRRVLFVDIDHNGPQATVHRLLAMGAPRDALADPTRFRYVEPEDKPHLVAVVADSADWRPAVAVVDSIGELLPLMNLSSNSPDDFTIANTSVLKPLAMSGACVVAIDHLAKNTDSRASGQTGTAAKKRAAGGVSIRVTVSRPFTPGRGGAAVLTINKDRHGGLREHCPPPEGKEQAAGTFTLDSSTEGAIRWYVRPPAEGDSAVASGVTEADLRALDQLDPPPKSVRDARFRLEWSNDRAANALRSWRSRPVPEEQGTLTQEGDPQ